MTETHPAAVDDGPVPPVPKRIIPPAHTPDGEPARPTHLVDLADSNSGVRWDRNFLPEFAGLKPMTIQMIGEQTVNPVPQTCQRIGLDHHIAVTGDQPVGIVKTIGRTKLRC